MKKLVLLLFLSTPLFGTELVLDNWGGINTDDDPLFLKVGSPNSQNIVSDEGNGITGRNGFTSFSTETVTGMWNFSHSNGTNYLIVKSSNTLKADAGGDGTFEITISTVPFSGRLGVAQLGDRLYFINNTDGLKYWNTTSVTVSSAALVGQYLASHKSRLWATGVTGSERTLFGSKFNDGDTWNLVTNPTVNDPVQIAFSGSYDEIFTALYSSFQDKLVMFRPHSFMALYGDDRETFEIRVISDRIGTAYPESIQDADGFLTFLGPQRTIWQWDGGVFIPQNKISEPIDNLMATVVQGDANSRSWTQTTQADFDSGTVGTGLSTSLSPNDIVFSSTSVDAFTDGDFTSSPTWTVFDNVGPSTATINNSPSLGNILNMQAVGSGFSIGLHTTNSNNSIGGWTFDVIDGLDDPISFKMCSEVPTVVQQSASDDCYALVLDDFFDYEIYENGTLLSSTTAGTYNGNYNIGFFLDNSGNISVTRDGVVLVSANDSTITNITHISIGVAQNDSSPAIAGSSFDNFLFHPTVSTFTSTSFNIGNNISTWGEFTGTFSNNDGTVSFAIYGDTNTAKDITNAATFTSSQTITNGSIPTISTASYVFVTSRFERSISTQAPTLNDFKVTWNEGSTLNVSSMYTNQRYWLGVAVSSTSNNRVLVFDKNRQWQVYNGINADVMSLFNSNSLFGNGTGIYQAETGFTDNGSNITSFYTTPVFATSGPLLNSIFNDLYLITSNSDSTITPVYRINGVNTEYSLASQDMSTALGYNYFKIGFPLTQLHQGQFIDFKYTVTGSDDWRLLNTVLDFIPGQVPQ